MKKYNVGGYVWIPEAEEYVFDWFEFNLDYDEAKKKYDSLTPSKDINQIELWEKEFVKLKPMGCKRILKKDSTGEYSE